MTSSTVTKTVAVPVRRFPVGPLSVGGEKAAGGFGHPHLFAWGGAQPSAAPPVLPWVSVSLGNRGQALRMGSDPVNKRVCS